MLRLNLFSPCVAVCISSLDSLTSGFSGSFRPLTTSSLGFGSQPEGSSLHLRGRSPEIDDFFREPVITNAFTPTSIVGSPGSAVQPVSPSTLLACIDTEESSTTIKRSPSVDRVGERDCMGEETSFSSGMLPKSDIVEDVISPHFLALSLPSSLDSPLSKNPSRNSLKLLFALGAKSTSSSHQRATSKKRRLFSIIDKPKKSNTCKSGGSLPNTYLHSESVGNIVLNRDNMPRGVKQEPTRKDVTIDSEEKNTEQEGEKRIKGDEDSLPLNLSSVLDDDVDLDNDLNTWSSMDDTAFDIPSKRRREKGDEAFVAALPGDRQGRMQVMDKEKDARLGHHSFLSGAGLNPDTDCDVSNTSRGGIQDEEAFMDQLIEEEAASMLAQCGNRNHPVGFPLEVSEIGVEEHMREIEKPDMEEVFSPSFKHEIHSMNLATSSKLLEEDMSAFDKEAASVELEMVGDQLLSRRRR